MGRYHFVFLEEEIVIGEFVICKSETINPANKIAGFII